MSLVHVYLLSLEHGKYYVGASVDPIKSVEEHREGLGPAWTQIHRPVRLLEVSEAVAPSEVDDRVRGYMFQYGVENVRGGKWEHLRLLDAERQAILHRSHAAVGNNGQPCVVC